VHDSLRKRSWSGLAGKNDCNRKRGDEVKRNGESQARGYAAEERRDEDEIREGGVLVGGDLGSVGADAAVFYV